MSQWSHLSSAYTSLDAFESGLKDGTIAVQDGDKEQLVEDVDKIIDKLEKIKDLACNNNA